MLDRVISGGQTGADQAALRAARSVGIPTGGWAPLGWLTEDGPAPWLAGFGLVECPEPGYPARSRANVRDSDATLWFGSIDSRGFVTTHDAALVLMRPFLIVYRGATRPSQVRGWLAKANVRVLYVAWNRESVSPGIGERVERFLVGVFRRAKQEPP
jgi:Circularly permutated YpsA SLOG family